MRVRRRDVLKLIVSGAAATTLGAKNAHAFGGGAIHRDVCIIGGGSAGTYAAVKLRDLGRSVLVLEETDRLGGHAETFRDASTGAQSDIGVVIFPDAPIVQNYFGRFGVPVARRPGGGGGTSINVDFRTGLPVENVFTPAPAALGAALTQYLNLLTTRYAFIGQNGYRLPEPGPLLEEVVQPFGSFAESNGLNALLPTFFRFEQGFGNLLNATTLYILKNMSADVLAGVLRGAFVAVPSGVGALYEAAEAELADDVLYGAKIRHVDRSRRGIRVLVQAPEGLRVVHCKKLLVTAPPVLSNFQGFDLDLAEFTTFVRFRPNYYYTAVAKVGGYPAGVSLQNTALDTPFNLPPLPGIYSLGPIGNTGFVNVKYGSTVPLPDALVKAKIRADIERVNVAGVGPLDFQGYGIFKSHSPYALMASPGDIRNGFYSRLEALQGRNDTFYAGAAFQTHSSAAIWAYIEELTPRIVA